MKIRNMVYSFFAALVMATLPLTARAVSEGQVAPQFSLVGADGKPVSLAQYKGKVVYLDFWASWCGPCKESLPFMNELKERYNLKGLAVLAVNIDKSREPAVQMVNKVGAQFTVAFDPEGKVPQAYALPTMPTSYVIGKDGQVKLVHKGFRSGDKEELFSAIEKLLGGK